MLLISPGLLSEYDLPNPHLDYADKTREEQNAQAATKQPPECRKSVKWSKTDELILLSSGSSEDVSLRVSGMTCSSCVSKVERALLKQLGEDRIALLFCIMPSEAHQTSHLMSPWYTRV